MHWQVSNNIIWSTINMLAPGFCAITLRRLFAALGIRIRIRRIRMFLGLPDPDPLVRGTDPDPLVRGTHPGTDPDPVPDPSLFS